MKIILYIFFFIYLLISCSIEPTQNWLDFDYHIDYSNYKGEDDIMKINNWCQTKSNIAWISRSTKELNYFNYPKYTLDTQQGNCSDKALVKLGLIFKILNIKGKLVLLDNKNINEFGHTIIYCNGKFYDGYQEFYNTLDNFLQNNQNYTLKSIIEFDEIQYLNFQIRPL